MTSLGLGRRRPSHLAFVSWRQQFGPGPLGQEAGKLLANELYHGGFPPAVVEIPIAWLRPPIAFRHDPPIGVAEVGRAGGPTARAVNEATIAASAGRAWKFAATVDSVAAADAAALARHAVAFGTMPRPRSAVLTLALNSRTDTEIWRILGVQQGAHIRLTGGPDDLALIRDTFTRSVADNWDVTDTGQPWVIDAGPAADFDVNGTQGTITMSAVNSERRAILNLGYSYIQTVQVWNQTPVVPTGAPINWGALLRWQDASNYYWLDVQVGLDSSLTLRLVKRVAGVLTQVTTVPTSVIHDTSVPRVLIAEVTGRRIRARLYASDSADPVDWMLDEIDGDLTSGTWVGCIARLMTGSLNTGNTVRFDNLRATAPDPHAWPEGAADHVVSGIVHAYEQDARLVQWATSPIIGSGLGVPGPWFYTEASLTSSTDTIPA